MGLGGTAVRHYRHMVLTRRRLLHRVYGDRRPGASSTASGLFPYTDAALDAFVANIIVAVVATLILDALRVARAGDEPIRQDYQAAEVREAMAAD